MSFANLLSLRMRRMWIWLACLLAVVLLSIADHTEALTRTAAFVVEALVAVAPLVGPGISWNSNGETGCLRRHAARTLL